MIKFNEKVIKALNIPTEQFVIKGITTELPRNPKELKKTPIILVPKDVLRELPVANDWDQVCQSAAENAELRDKVNCLIGEIWKAKVRKDKEKLRESALASAEAFSTFLNVIHGIDPDTYDFENDPEGILVWRKIHETVAKTYLVALITSCTDF